MKLITLLKLMMSSILCMLSLSSFAATGWCTTVGGVKQYNYNYTQVFADPSQNFAGKLVNNAYSWSSGGNYIVGCDCTGTNAPGPQYYKMTPGDLTQLEHTSGNVSFYSLNNYLSISSQVWVAAGVGAYVQVPQSNISNLGGGAKVCGGNSTSFSTGGQGSISLYFVRPFVGQINIPTTKIVDVYSSTVSGTFGGSPIASVIISGSVTVPQSCNINAGQVINVELGNVLSENIKTKGAISNGYTPKVVNMTLVCNNISQGVNISLSINGETSTGNANALKTTNNDIGVKILDSTGTVVSPNSGRLPVTMNYSAQTGTSVMSLAPMNVTGNVPSAGQFNAIATINAEMQ